MSRRAGQDGHIEKSGKWYVVRWWMDVPGQVERAHPRRKICPISGPVSLTEFRRAREIIAESGADTVDYFKRVVGQETAKTFEEQAVYCLKVMRTRKRKPVSPGTITDMQRILRLYLNPNIGSLPLSEVNNGVLKTVVASAVNGEGEQVYPRKWNHKFADMPIVKGDEQNTPSFSPEVMTGLARWKYPRERMLFILCGAIGPRVGEALGIEIDKHISADFSTIKVRQQARRGKIEGRLKTKHSLRDFDLHPSVRKLLKEFVGDRKSGFLFCTRNGKPLQLSNVLRRHLHPTLKKLNYVNPHTGDHKAGSHAFRRFRNTYLRNYTGCPDGLIKYWMGYAGKDMGDL